MEICLVLVFKDTNNLGIDVPAIVEGSYRSRKAHKFVLVTMSGQNVSLTNNRDVGKHTLSVINHIVIYTTPLLDPMPCIDFARAIVELEDVRSCLARHVYYLRHNRNLHTTIQRYSGTLIARIGERVAVSQTEISSAPSLTALRPVQSPPLQSFPA